MKIRWYDWLVYRLFQWRWNPILKRDAVTRKLLVAWIETFDKIPSGSRVAVTVTIEEVTEEQEIADAKSSH